VEVGKEPEASSASNGIQQFNAQYRQKMRRTRWLFQIHRAFLNNKSSGEFRRRSFPDASKRGSPAV